jgi:hypothetical protein
VRLPLALALALLLALAGTGWGWWLHRRSEYARLQAWMAKHRACINGDPCPECQAQIRWLNDHGL